MKLTNHSTRHKAWALILTTLVSSSFSMAGDGQLERQRGIETKQDLPGDFTKYFGQELDRFREIDRRLAKVDMDADLNMDGAIRQGDALDQGAFEATPPGLVIGRREMSKVLIYVMPYRVDFGGDAVFSLELAGINRAAATGEFATFDEEVASVGHVRVWADKGRTQLLLDSADPAKRYHEWSVDYTRYPANLLNIIPRFVYIEGIKPSGAYLGDLRFMATVSHRLRTGEAEVTSAKSSSEGIATAEANRTPLLKRFRTSFDHILLTITESPMPKQFINNNVEEVWLTAEGGGQK